MKGITAGAGYAPMRFPEEYFPWERFGGCHDEIGVRVLLLRGGTELCIVSVELPSLKPYSMIDDFRREIAATLAIPFEQVWLAVTHNVSAPHVPPMDSPEKHVAHLEMVRSAIFNAIEAARRDLRPACFGTADSTADVNVNRDILTPEGWFHGISGTGPSDKTVSLIRIDDCSGKPIAALFNYAVKTAVMDESLQEDGFRYVTADLTGTACRIAEKVIGAPVIYFMGAAGDQVPCKKSRYHKLDENGCLTEVDFGAQGFVWVKELGELLAQGVHQAYTKAKTSSEVVCRIAHAELVLPGQEGFPQGQPNVPRKSYDYKVAEDRTVETELLRIGDAVILGIKPETTSIVGIRLREQSPFRHTMIAAMVNGGMNYMADETAYDRFLFEGTHSVLQRGAAETYIEQIIPILKELEKEI